MDMCVSAFKDYLFCVCLLTTVNLAELKLRRIFATNHPWNGFAILYVSGVDKQREQLGCLHIF